ncbi:comB7 lipoprotein [Helicobacter cetorum]|nr:comB7 lipoprotein [Helicobacter cetorum]
MKIFFVILGLILLGCSSKVHEMKKSPCAFYEKPLSLA